MTGSLRKYGSLMAISDAARKNHDELFPGEVSTLAVTVPYAGMGKVLDFLHATNDVLTEQRAARPRRDRTGESMTGR